MRLNNHCNNAILRAVAKAYLTLKHQGTSLELFEFMKENKIISKSIDVSPKRIGSILDSTNHESTNYQIFRKVGTNSNDETVWELTKNDRWNV